ncbi:transketolase [Streptomyces johnsoniae]|uniref:Transketolase n=1 Tax=Streptomyces johnsoniae TaxID=3075532 RepID=A0ABU2S720_9ACTN|nr:transketolase [Streptomyces sp. DSM 41886]MDT0444715.1 transketolase [Streptomyces sp. DSM 41886]
MTLRPVPGSARQLRELRRSLIEAPVAERRTRLAGIAAAIRRRDLEMILRAGMGHVGGDFSAVDILTVLYLLVLDCDPERPRLPERDRFIQSKGHGSGALYATLSYAGFFADADLDTYMAPLSPLNGHPDCRKIPGVETNTGPLGHGLPFAVGSAIAARLDGSPRRTFVLTGDGELQEGSNWEAALTAAQHGLDNLTVVVDRNGLQQGARTEETSALEPLPAKWEAFGFTVRTVDGHDHEALRRELGAPAPPGRPRCLIAVTQKGRGVSFMADRVEWHHRVPNADEARRAMEELQG